MNTTTMRRSRLLGAAFGLLFVCSAGATSVPRITFNELTDKSEVIAAGQVTRTWSDWDATHKYIWTHYELAVSSAYKGAAASRVVISEPGGIVDGIGMLVAGAVGYTPGDQVFVFLERMPNGYLRTTGWGQGQYRVDSRGLVHASESLREENITGGANSLGTLEGSRMTDLAGKVAARIRVQKTGKN